MSRSGSLRCNTSVTGCPSSLLGAKQTYGKTKSWWRSCGHRARTPSHIFRYTQAKLTGLAVHCYLLYHLWSFVGIGPFWQGEEARRTLGAVLYLECSAKLRENVDDLFREATKRALLETRVLEEVRERGSLCACSWLWMTDRRLHSNCMSAHISCVVFLLTSQFFFKYIWCKIILVCFSCRFF